jgi:hypothetical protein
MELCRSLPLLYKEPFRNNKKDNHEYAEIYENIAMFRIKRPAGPDVYVVGGEAFNKDLTAVTSHF